VVSVDVEAFSFRAAQDPIDTLIWGRFPEGDFGLDRMMTIAERRGVRLSLFLDYPEFFTYGEAFLDIGREIVRRGHELNLHLHLDSFPRSFLEGLRKRSTSVDLNTFTDHAAADCVSSLLDLHSRVTATPPVALRGGGYRYNGSMLRALRTANIPASSNYNRAAKLQPYDLGDRAQFQWETGTLELPIPSQHGFLRRGYQTHFNFNIRPFSAAPMPVAIANSRLFLDRFHRELGDEAVATFVMHSWSFLRMDQNGRFSSVNPDAPELFEAFLADWSKSADIVCVDDVVRLAQRGEIPCPGPVPIPERTQQDASERAVPPVEEVRVNGAEELVDQSCPICQTPVTEFVDYNGPKRQCPGCGSTERQRVLAEVYVHFIKPEFDLAKKDVLVAAPGAAEKRFFKAQGVAWRSVDIRPEVKADIVADLCDMSNVPDASFDAVVASFVLTCVHDLNACLFELFRVLRPGGRLLTCDPVRFGSPTVEYTDSKQITAWYGQEAFDKYRIGSFRTFGDLDLIRVLQTTGFLVKTLYGWDAPTRSRWVWHMSIKPI
jgi:SAM-dependent methyltransferase